MNKELILPFEGCDEDFREKLARTNFWLAEMRKPLDIRVEVDVNWHPMGFNSCGLISKTNEPLGFCFYSKSFEKSFEISEIPMYFISSKNVTAEKIKNELQRANEKFNKALKERGKAFFFQVSRFSTTIKFMLDLNLEFRIGEFENPKTSIKIQENFPQILDLEDKLLCLFPNSEIESYFQHLPSTTYFGVEFILDNPISEVEFIEKLKTVIPNLQNSYLGWNLRSRNSISNLDCVVDISPRQF